MITVIVMMIVQFCILDEKPSQKSGTVIATMINGRMHYTAVKTRMVQLSEMKTCADIEVHVAMSHSY